MHHEKHKKYLSIKGHNEQIIILIVFIQPISPVSVKVRNHLPLTYLLFDLDIVINYYQTI